MNVILLGKIVIPSILKIFISISLFVTNPDKNILFSLPPDVLTKLNKTFEVFDITNPVPGVNFKSLIVVVLVTLTDPATDVIGTTWSVPAGVGSFMSNGML